MLSVMIKLKVNTILLLSIFQYYFRFTQLYVFKKRKTENTSNYLQGSL